MIRTPFLALLAAACAAAADPPPGRTYTNPVFSGDMPDPTVIRSEGMYYAMGTTGNRRTPDGRIFTLLRSTNLVDWENLGGALVPPSDNRKYQYWAPEAAADGGKFYIYYAMGGIEPERFEIRAAISAVPQGPYTDTGNVLADCEHNRFTIDPFPFRDSDGQWYFFYSRNFTNAEAGTHAGTGIVVDKMTDMTHLAGDCHVVVRARYDWTLYQANRPMPVYGKTFDWHTIEGACVLKHEGRYYCFYSGANYGTTRYGVDYVVAERPLGPYSGQGRAARILHSVPGQVRGPGHNDMAVAPDGHTEYIVYHAWDADMRVRQMCIDKLIWTADGPRCLGPTFTPQPMP
ncbi:MAG TPA: glycoside hydrolase family 43 protein [Verrucomicrobiae bacterium]|jgi:beta-xylosidase